MTDLPERIWAARSSKTDATMWWPDDAGGVGREYIRADHAQAALDAAIDRAVKAERDKLLDVIREAGDVIESYYKTTGIDLGDASRMPFYADTMAKIEAAMRKDT